MKNSFFLYFLVLSPLIFGQNSLRSSESMLESTKTFERSYFPNLPAKHLTILDKNYNKGLDNDWLINPTDTIYSPNNLSSLQLKEQLKNLDYKTPFKVNHNPTLERYIRVFLKNRRENIAVLIDKSNYYFPIFETYLDKYDLPIELKYLAVVESALQPNANSPVGAKGLWQFMYQTGKQYGLEVNSYVDERFDPIKSTEAACQYLSYLYKRFDSWDLALAAYNSGPGNVAKAIKRSGGKRNYWEIRAYLPQETKGYLPAFLATYYIFEHATSLQIKPEKSELSFYEIDTIHLKKQLKFNQIERNISISNEMLKALNPQYKKEIIPFDQNKSYILTLPVNLVDQFLEKETTIYLDQNKEVCAKYAIPITSKNSYIVHAGDNLPSIAKKFNITVQQLKKWNGLQTDFLIEQQRLVVTDQNFNTHPNGQVATKELLHKKSFVIHTVKPGDTLFKISRSYPEVTIHQIRDWNNILDVKYLKPGTQLKIY